MDNARKDSIFARLLAWFLGQRRPLPDAITREFATTQTQQLEQAIRGGVDSIHESLDDVREQVETHSQSLRSLRKATLVFDEARNELMAAHATLREARPGGVALEVAQHFRTWFVGAYLRKRWDELINAWHANANNSIFAEEAAQLLSAVHEFKRHFDHVNTLLEPEGLRLIPSVFSEFDPARHEVVEILDIDPELASDLRHELAKAGLVNAEAETIITSEIYAGVEHRVNDAWKIRHFARVTAFTCPPSTAQDEAPSTGSSL